MPRKQLSSGKHGVGWKNTVDRIQGLRCRICKGKIIVVKNRKID